MIFISSQPNSSSSAVTAVQRQPVARAMHRATSNFNPTGTAVGQNFELRNAGGYCVANLRSYPDCAPFAMCSQEGVDVEWVQGRNYTLPRPTVQSRCQFQFPLASKAEREFLPCRPQAGLERPGGNRHTSMTGEWQLLLGVCGLILLALNLGHGRPTFPNAGSTHVDTR